MCGILGIIGKDTKCYDSKIESMIDTLRKRGPDDRGIAAVSQGYLGQTRLSILDLVGGHQPMKDNKEDVTVVFNGEIYNYESLRKNLELRGHVFKSKSDTEVILKAFLEYGEECVNYLDGMFAFAIWDERTKTLFAARDRFGEKPFYYGFDNSNNLIFASEIKAIKASGGFVLQIDPVSIDAYLELMYIPPLRTVYKNIFVLPPASKLKFTNGKIETKKYWSLKKKALDISIDDAKKVIKRLLDQSIRRMMVADVEVGTFLSGGVDSTLVTIFAKKYSNNKVKTFSVGYDNHTNELPFAKQASDSIGTDHHAIIVNNKNIDDLEKVCAYFDEPHADSSNFPQYQLSKLASDNVKVVLTGDGADELFFGYDHYSKYKKNYSFRNILNVLSGGPYREFRKNIQIFPRTERAALYQTSTGIIGRVWRMIAEIRWGGIVNINNYDLNSYLPGQLLFKVDRTAMMNSLETRCPFLDRELVEFVYNLPDEYKIKNGVGKYLLKEILLEWMPNEFVNRRKQGFGGPVKNWLDEPVMREYVINIFNKQTEIYGFMKKTEVENLLNKFYFNNEKNLHYRIWVLLCLELWLRAHK